MGILPADFAGHFGDIAGFRNVLVHNYLDVDLDAVVRMLREHLGDFEVYAGNVESWCAQTPEE